MDDPKDKTPIAQNGAEMFTPGSRSEAVVLIPILTLVVLFIVLISFYGSWKAPLLVLVAVALAQVPVLRLIQLGGLLIFLVLIWAMISGIT